MNRNTLNTHTPYKADLSKVGAPTLALMNKQERLSQLLLVGWTVTALNDIENCTTLPALTDLGETLQKHLLSLEDVGMNVEPANTEITEGYGRQYDRLLESEDTLESSVGELLAGTGVTNSFTRQTN